MKKYAVLFFGFCCFLQSSFAQTNAQRWADSVFKTLSLDEQIAQLFIVRSSAPPLPGSFSATFLDSQVVEAIQKYKVGGICLFQGGPQQQAQRINRFQAMSKVPLLVTIDAEWGLGMRMDSVMSLPRPLMLGATSDASLAFKYGALIGAQCKRIGIQVNYGPVFDLNNNPANPVINDRSFGEDKYKVSAWAIQYMKGQQSMGIMTVAKHFPGHGDVAVDSHLDLPIINKTKAQLDSFELFPFKAAIDAGIDGVMTAHLSVPAIDSGANRPTSISYNTITKLLRGELGFKGLTFTDALEMKGITKYYPGGEISLQSILAGNDLLCLPADIPESIKLIKKALKKKQLDKVEFEERVKRVLMAKYNYGLAEWKPVELYHLTEDLNKDVPQLAKEIALQAITLLKTEKYGPFPLAKGKKIAYLAVGTTQDNEITKQVRKDFDAQVFYFDYGRGVDKALALASYLKQSYDVVVVGIHGYARKPMNQFGISAAADTLIQLVQQQNKTITLAFGNPYLLKKYTNTSTLLACFEDDPYTQGVAADILYGRVMAHGTLPVSISDDFKLGAGILNHKALPVAPLTAVGIDPAKFARVDSIVNDAIRKQAIPGAVVLVAKDGKVVYDKGYGYLTYDSTEAVYPETIYDLASVTKIMATTVSIMKLYDEGKVDIQKTLGDYLSWTKGTNKAPLKLWDILLHQAGLNPFIPFYRETVDTNLGSIPLSKYYSYRKDSIHTIRVAENMYMRADWVDTMYNRILTSALTPAGKYVYSDNDFIFLGKVVEAVSGMPLEEYVKKTFYDPLDMASTGFKPRERFPLNAIAPTEEELGFRQQLIHGDVHDPGAAMFGGVAGHAGLFSNAYDLAILAEVLQSKGKWNGVQYFKPETVELFTSYKNDSRRGLGFDKPEKDNATRKEPYPALNASPATFGHTGFTGTCIWIDPVSHLTFIMLSNRVHNNGDANRFLKMNVRPKVLDAIYEAMK